MEKSNRDALALKFSKNRHTSSWEFIEEAFKAGWDARDEEIAELNKENKALLESLKDWDDDIGKVQDQLTAAREEARALREALRLGITDNVPADVFYSTACKILAAHAEREEHDTGK